ncbi:MAG: small multi-drug export protein [Candidatus Nanoarchaeia archaeon]
MLSEYLILTGLAIAPISEARGAVLYGLSAGLNPAAVFLISFLANVLTIPLIFWFLQQANFLGFAQKLFGKNAYDWIGKNKQKIDKWGEFALYGFVAVPLPITGGWMGALIATLLNMDRKKAYVAIILGILTATTITFVGIGSGIFLYNRL